MQGKMGNAQIFVRIEDYRGVLSMLEHIKDKLAEARGTLEKLKDLRKEEDAEFEQWEGALGEIGKRVDTIDRELLEPDGM